MDDVYHPVLYAYIAARIIVDWSSFSSHVGLTDYEQNNLELEVLQENHSILYQAVSVDIVPSLFEKKLITSDEMGEIYSHTSSGARNTALLTALRKKICPLHKFCQILSNTPGQEYLAEKVLRGM